MCRNKAWEKQKQERGNKRSLELSERGGTLHAGKRRVFRVLIYRWRVRYCNSSHLGNNLAIRDLIVCNYEGSAGRFISGPKQRLVGFNPIFLFSSVAHRDLQR